jgi:hypothetical protein
MSNYTDLKKWVSQSIWGKHLTAMQPQGPVYHVSHNKRINRFIPSIGRRQATDEDRSIARISCAPTVLGCFKGHMGIETQFHQKHGTTKDNVPFDIAYQGGWKVYAFYPEAYLLPDELLLHDGYKSGEVWLTSYNTATQYYTGAQEATCFYETITYRSRSGSNPAPHGVLFMEVVSPQLQFSPRHRLTKGFWCITGPTQQAIRTFADDSDFQVQQITEADYLKAKHGSAEMLGYQEVPVFLNWK